MLSARAAAITTVSNETPASAIINMRARVVRGGVSVGLNAVAVVNETNR